MAVAELTLWSYWKKKYLYCEHKNRKVNDTIAINNPTNHKISSIYLLQSNFIKRCF